MRQAQKYVLVTYVGALGLGILFHKLMHWWQDSIDTVDTVDAITTLLPQKTIVGWLSKHVCIHMVWLIFYVCDHIKVS